MAENSKIEWTHHTFNPWMGCTKVHTGCAHCYAEELMDHRYGKAKWGTNGTRVRTTAANWRKPLQWNRAAESAGERRRVFCASLADVFEDWDGPVLDHTGCKGFVDREGVYRWHSMPADESMLSHIGYRQLTLNDLRRDLFALIDSTPWLDWLLLTKRPENVRRMWPHRSGPWIKDGEACVESWHRPNVWIGTSISDQQTANVAVPRLLECRDLCPVLFLSAEPLVGKVSFRWAQWQDISREPGAVNGHLDGMRGIDWIIVGGESGAGRRPMELAWARSIRDDCREAEVAFFMKQIDKVQPIPNDLMIRQFPAWEAAGVLCG